MSDLPQILLAEDDAQYAFVFQLALKQAGILNPVLLLPSREHVLDYLNGQGPYGDRATHPLPAAIVLALGLPFLDDFKVLRALRQRPEFNHIPVVVLSGVEYDHERARAQELGADCYDVKPSDFEGLVHLARRLRRCWSHPAEHPAAA